MRAWRWIGRVVFALLALASLALVLRYEPLPRLRLLYRALDTRLRFGIGSDFSPIDYDMDGIDDRADLMLGARRHVQTQPIYDPGYFEGGYPPEGRGVCADVLWQGLLAAGYDFKAMLDEDIASQPRIYPLSHGKPDPNIDFRRVAVLRVYFAQQHRALSRDPSEYDQFMPGDIVFYPSHIAIVSDKRNDEGRPYIIHHTGHGAFEEDKLGYSKIQAHYRWGLLEETEDEAKK